MGFALGISEDRFWRMTLAQVTAIYRIKVLEWDRTRDFYVAQNTAVQCSTSDKLIHPDELLHIFYPKRKQSVIITPDPDRGAVADPSLRAGLKDRTERVRAKRRAKRA